VGADFEGFGSWDNMQISHDTGPSRSWSAGLSGSPRSPALTGGEASSPPVIAVDAEGAARTALQPVSPRFPAARPPCVRLRPFRVSDFGAVDVGMVANLFLFNAKSIVPRTRIGKLCAHFRYLISAPNRATDARMAKAVKKRMGRPPKPPGEHLVFIGLRLHPKVVRKVDDVARAAGNDRSETIRCLIEAGLAARKGNRG
jgi:hypothetical protein